MSKSSKTQQMSYLMMLDVHQLDVFADTWNTDYIE